MKQKIRLTEGDLHRIIRKCVNEALRKDNDPSWSSEFNYKWFMSNIEDGNYDDVLKNIIQHCHEGFYSDYYDKETDIDEFIEQAAHDRLCLIDKKYALKYGKDPGQKNFRYNDADYALKDSPIRNRNVHQEKYYNWDPYVNDMLRARFPNVMKGLDQYKATGKISGKNLSAGEKEVFGTDQTDKRPLHRKGSLNRAFDA